MADVSETELNAERKRAEEWQKRFSNFDRDRAIAEASVRHGAKNVAQIRDLIGHKIVLAEQPGGTFASAIEADGKMVPVDEFVASLSKAPEHSNLFHAKREATQAGNEVAAARDSESLPRKIGRALKALVSNHKRGAVGTGSPTDSPARKIARGLRGLQ